MLRRVCERPGKTRYWRKTAPQRPTDHEDGRMPIENTREDVVASIDRLHDDLVDVLRAIKANTESLNRWGAEIESRLSYVEENTRTITED